MAMTKSDLRKINEAITENIKVTVNGKIDNLTKKIDAHNLSHETDMQRVLPVIEAFEASEKFAADAKKKGKVVIIAVASIAGFVTAVGSAYLIVMQIFFPGHTPN